VARENAEEWRERRRRQRAEEPRHSGFFKARHAETSFAAQLRHLARQVVRIIEALTDSGDLGFIEPHEIPAITDALDNYAEAIEPWAQAVSWRMIAETNRRDKTAWEQYTKGMSAALRQELREAPIGAEVQRLMADQVHLITSLPREAASWVHEQSLQALEAGRRYEEKTAIESGWDPERGRWTRTPPPRTELTEALAKATPHATEKWLRNRATLIARTETARTASVLVQARSSHIGAESYIWYTAKDWKVRESHRKLHGSVQRWDAPPLSDPPDYHSHPGQIWNCRCTALPVIPE
jgi:SPP1 gp7 family putative phage head morphogenesis protein